MAPRTQLLLTNAAIATGLVIERLRGMAWGPLIVSALLLFSLANIIMLSVQRTRR